MLILPFFLFGCQALLLKIIISSVKTLNPYWIFAGLDNTHSGLPTLLTRPVPERFSKVLKKGSHWKLRAPSNITQ